MIVKYNQVFYGFGITAAPKVSVTYFKYIRELGFSFAENLFNNYENLTENEQENVKDL